MHPYLEHSGPIPFAHRGGAGAAPENTLIAFADAVDLGFRYLETDVHATIDGVLVAFHDDDLRRTCGLDTKISEMTWSDVAKARVHGTEPIPLLEDILGSWNHVRVNIDCKSDAAINPLIATLRRLNCLDRVCLGSFSDRRLRVLREALGPTLCTSLGPRSVARLVAAGLTIRPLASRLPAYVAQVPMRQGVIPVTTTRFVDVAHSLGVQVHVWTVDDPNHMVKLLDMGVDGIMTDDCRALRDVLIARGDWKP